MQQLPAELYQECNTIEYIQQQAKPVMPPAYVFVVDTSVAEDELRACIASLSQALTTLPEYAQVRTKPLSKLRLQGECTCYTGADQGCVRCSSRHNSSKGSDLCLAYSCTCD